MFRRVSNGKRNAGYVAKTRVALAKREEHNAKAIAGG